MPAAISRSVRSTAGMSGGDVSERWTRSQPRSAASMSVPWLHICCTIHSVPPPGPPRAPSPAGCTAYSKVLTMLAWSRDWESRASASAACVAELDSEPEPKAQSMSLTATTRPRHSPRYTAV